MIIMIKVVQFRDNQENLFKRGVHRHCKRIKKVTTVASRVKEIQLATGQLSGIVDTGDAQE